MKNDEEIVRRRNYLLSLTEQQDFQRYIGEPLRAKREAYMKTLLNIESNDKDIRVAQAVLDFLNFFDGIFEQAERRFVAKQRKDKEDVRRAEFRSSKERVRITPPAGSGSIG